MVSLPKWCAPIAGLWVLSLASCQYGASFSDCTIQCSSATGCPNGFECGNQGVCRPVGTPSSCDLLPDAPDPMDGSIDGSIDAGAACQVTGCADPAFVCDTAAGTPVFGQCIPNYTELPEDCSASVSIGKARETTAPAIWRVQFVRDTDCSPTQRGYQLTLDYFDPTGNGPTAASSGTVMRADFGFANPLNLTAGGFAFSGSGLAGTMLLFPCVNAQPVPASVAVRIVDDIGNQSNTVCLTP